MVIFIHGLTEVVKGRCNVAENFEALPLEKQQRILNAAIEVFAQNEYKRASTDDIAAKAGISKGLLFYYFKNKKQLYLYTYNYVEEKVTETVTDAHFGEITDLFDLLDYSARKKYGLMAKYPHILEFAVRTFYAHSDEISCNLNGNMENAAQSSFAKYCSHIDTSKFRDDVNPVEIMEMLVWMTDGYMHDKQRSGVLDLDQLHRDYKRWSAIFKRIMYKEEYL